jgi:hypothetical protein
MSEAFTRLLKETYLREYGGEPPRSVWQIAYRAGQEIRAALLKANPSCPPEAVHTVELIAVDTALRVACEVLYRERNSSGSPDWYEKPFGKVSQWNLNGRK